MFSAWARGGLGGGRVVWVFYVSYFLGSLFRGWIESAPLLRHTLHESTKQSGVDSPFFSTIVLFKNRLFPRVFEESLERMRKVPLEARVPRDSQSQKPTPHVIPVEAFPARSAEVQFTSVATARWHSNSFG